MSILHVTRLWPCICILNGHPICAFKDLSLLKINKYAQKENLPITSLRNVTNQECHLICLVENRRDVFCISNVMRRVSNVQILEVSKRNTSESVDFIFSSHSNLPGKFVSNTVSHTITMCRNPYRHSSVNLDVVKTPARFLIAALLSVYPPIFDNTSANLPLVL
ncbi:hypothetical protein FF38_05586 [Lucilia cuprina]|uniref:Uncharacterized protein n=1 Tax=Lucilia cuprina TaxID=7375 RepID=A0A0L0BLL5_LUCCU|nr:hypothetical protein FF38_05586 [Lucilia cuprina]